MVLQKTKKLGSNVGVSYTEAARRAEYATHLERNKQKLTDNDFAVGFPVSCLQRRGVLHPLPVASPQCVKRLWYTVLIK